MSLPAGLPGMRLPIRLLPCGAFAACVEAAQR